ncbi:MAG: hypothetical protein IID45_09080 [Planctomycetes bacterium]|nr:hypothetical protein [Planctomycetota bacterium]
MSQNMARWGSVLGTLMMLTSTQTADAQWVSAINPCACAQPVVQACYRTVPVTEYRQITQTVMKPVYETKYVNQQVTVYRPVTETRTVSVPTVTYQNVTECRQITRDQGCWQTTYRRTCLMSPCQYDPRANLIGWLNRTAYSIRSTFTPRIVAHRQYVPRMVTYNVPITRRVAHHGTRQVTYNVTRMQAYTTTRKVAINTVRYVAQQTVRTVPVTVWRTVPIGTTVAYAAAPLSTALAPSPDPIGRTAKGSTKSRTADSTDDKFKDRRSDDNSKKFERDSSSLDSGDGGNAGIQRFQNTPNATQPEGSFVTHAPSRSLPSIVRASRWTATRRANSGPALITRGISVATATSRK